MKRPIVRILHETNPQKYFPVLYMLAERGEISISGSHRYSVFKEWLRAWLRDGSKINKRTRNSISDMKFRLSIARVKGEVIVFGFAPWDWRILVYRRLAKHNKVIYHTSWHDWQIDSVPRRHYPRVVRKYLREIWVKFLAQETVRVIAVTHNAAESLKSELSISSTVIPHSVPDVFFEARREKFATGNELKLLYVGEISEKKGVKTLLSLMSRLSGEKVSLSIVGSGPLVSEVKASRDSITYMGAIWDRHELAKVMAEHDLLILPSRRTKSWEELFGIVLIEALASGMAVISSNHIGPAGILAPVKGVGLYDENGIDLIYDQIMKFIHDEGELVRFRSAQKPVVDSYRISSVAEAWIREINLSSIECNNADRV